MKDFTRHPCGWAGCQERVPLYLWGCARHWYRLPETTRDKILKTAKDGNKKAVRATEAWVKARAQALDEARHYATTVDYGAHSAAAAQDLPAGPIKD